MISLAYLLSILNNACSYKIRKCILFSLPFIDLMGPGLPPAKSGPAPQRDTAYTLKLYSH